MALLKRSIPKVHKCDPLDQIAGKAGWSLSNLPRALEGQLWRLGKCRLLQAAIAGVEARRQSSSSRQ